ncbi:hypothetical protein CP556_04850 [Natrinema sp. CBA1119]|uniref:group I intron-associated PD-(D/E)XK endonuclease n=1 Tax=Natrinema sp. CBA1119 TaxID=1608465 RepID=UPI000BF770ED|nr:group I intron-associated PD-(D/E)XK endonuclease [Natrinema sp. CBA1119]PGF15514.1 hypothetical protein CP556_04850 [Natrinema sp. CBA1119]
MEEAFQGLSEPQKKGDATEGIIKAEFLSRGIPVLAPESDNLPYDLVIDRESDLLRIQCKTASSNDDSKVRFETRSTRVKRQGYERAGYDGKIDYFAVYNPVIGETYLVPIQDAPKTGMEIRYQKTKNGQTARVNWHEDYLIDTQLSGP